MKRIILLSLPIALFVVLVVFFYSGLQRDPSVIPSPLIGKPAPAFTLESLADPRAQVGSLDFRGRPYLLNVWATWCGGCYQEHAVLLSIARENRLPLVGLNWRDERGKAQRWLEELGNPYAAVAFDGDGRAAIDWGVYGAPETFLVSAAGVVLHKHIGPMTAEAWQRDFVPRLGQAEP